MNLILIGPQGSGKGTQAQKLIQQFHLTPVEPGFLLRQEAQKLTPRGRVINNLLTKGTLLPDGIIIQMIENFLEKKESDFGFVFDGYPRTSTQYQNLKKFLQKHQQKIDLAIYLHLSDAIAIQRLSSRLNCQKCGQIYNKITNPPPRNHTCQCGGQLFSRKDDQPAAVRTRLKFFHQATTPLLKELQKDQVLVKVDAAAAIDQVFTEILKTLKAKNLAPPNPTILSQSKHNHQTQKPPSPTPS